ncbi:MAG: hypothetical protein ACRD8Z_20825 [Nitrososphaeraceae archaeon]
MLSRTNLTFLSEKFLGHVCILHLIQMKTIVIVSMTAVISILVSIVATPVANTIFAATDNDNTVTGTGGKGGNDSSNLVAANGSSSNGGESAKSGINTTVCGPDPAHACKTTSGDR